jgi:uncharacterized protein YegL
MEDFERKLPVYFVLDCSESMIGDSIECVRTGMGMVTRALQSDPSALELVWASVITFASQAEVVVPLVELYRFHPPMLRVRPGTALGAALKLTAESIRRDFRPATPSAKGDWKPYVFIFSDGEPTDDWRAAANLLKQIRANVVAVAIGEFADRSLLHSLADHVFEANADSDSLMSVFKWVSASVQAGSVQVGSTAESATYARVEDYNIRRSELTVEARSSHLREIFLTVHCSDKKAPYLIRYRSADDGRTYEAVRAHPVEKEYLSGASGNHSSGVDTSRLHGVPDCPRCGNGSLVICGDCQTITCIPDSATSSTCFICGTSGTLGAASGSVSGRHG